MTAATLFEEDRFLAAAQEMDTSKLDGYEFFTESLCKSVECKIYRKYDEESGLYEYKIIGYLHDVLPELCKEVYMDLEYRKKWDSFVKDLREFEDADTKGIYWNVNFPFPMSNRDYTYVRQLRELVVDGVEVVVVLAKSYPLSSIPKKSGVIRVTDYHQSLAIKSDGKTGTKAFMHYFDNPGGMIPSWLINWAAKYTSVEARRLKAVLVLLQTGVPGFMTSMHDACVNYSEYLQSKCK